MRKRVLAIPLIAAGVVGATAAVSLGGGSTTARFERADLTGQSVVSKPLGLQANRTVRAILELDAAPVASRQAAARLTGGRLSDAERAALRGGVRASQETLVAKVRAEGGRVVARYADAINAVRVSVPAAKLGSLAATPGVVAVHPVRVYRRANDRGVPYIGGNEVWSAFPGRTGKGVKVAVIDTGIDYYHANLGGGGNPADFAADDGLTIEPGTFPTRKVVGGFDFVGDEYDASSDDPALLVPKPDPDPLDCDGHGSHVAGTAAGQGVKADGTPFTGPYDATTLSDPSVFEIAPGVAPEAEILGYKVFGCEGSTDVVVDAIDAAVRDGADVINMSLGSPYGDGDDADAIASNNATRAGVVVVAAAGNDGPNAYLVSSPSTAEGNISVAAVDTIDSFRSAQVTGAGPTPIGAINGNEAVIPSGGVTGTVKVLRTGTGAIALGCAQSDYAGTTGMIVVTVRGVCARVDRATFGQNAGAAAVIMVNNAAGLPPLEGLIPGVTIPFIGVPNTAAAALSGADGQQVTISDTGTVANPAFARFAPFSSGGPRSVDSAVKPDVTAPGVSVKSTGVGLGTKGVRVSGTSMATPHVAGAAALVVQANPTWTPQMVRAALANTADASSAKILNYNPRIGGSGVVNVRRAVDAQVLAMTADGRPSLSFGYEQLRRAYSATESFTLRNLGGAPVTYDLAAAFQGNALGITASVQPATVTVAPGSRQRVRVTLTLDAAGVAALPAASQAPGAVAMSRGAVTATPQGSVPGAYPLRVAFGVVPRGLSEVSTRARIASTRTTAAGVLRMTNRGIAAGNADLYAWGLSDRRDQRGAPYDARAVGVQSLPGSLLDPDFYDQANDRLLVFAVNMHGRWSNASESEYDIALDTTGDGAADVVLIGADFGAVLAGADDGRLASFAFDATTGDLIDAFFADAPMNGSTLLLPMAASSLGLSPGDGGFSYSAQVLHRLEGSGEDVVDGEAAFDAFDPALTTGEFATIAPGAVQEFTVTADRTRPGSRGWLVVTQDDENGAEQADTVGLPDRRQDDR